ncbi:MAG: hypothetical protein ACOY4U_11255 [Pseudomonadota bacterium]
MAVPILLNLVFALIFGYEAYSSHKLNDDALIKKAKLRELSFVNEYRGLAVKCFGAICSLYSAAVILSLVVRAPVIQFMLLVGAIIPTLIIGIIFRDKVKHMKVAPGQAG